MLKENCRIGMKVVFGRPNGEKTVGEVVEISETKAHIKTLESRGDGNRGSEEHRTKIKPAGTVWWMTLDIVEPLDKPLLEALVSLPPKEERLLEYLQRGSETLVGLRQGPHGPMCEDEKTAILQAIASNYRRRSSIVEGIEGYRQDLHDAHHDAAWSARKREIARLEIESLNRFLDDQNRRLGLLFEALGRPVSEAVSRAWHDHERIRQEIDKEFSDANDASKAHRHWRKIREYLPDDRDHMERILLWNERRLSPAWTAAGLSTTPTHAESRNVPQGEARWKTAPQKTANSTASTSPSGPETPSPDSASTPSDRWGTWTSATSR